MNLQNKLRPARFSDMSPMMAALVECIVGGATISPQLVALTVTSDGFLLARRKGDLGYDAFIGAYEDFRNNWLRLLDAAELSEVEKDTANKIFQTKVGRQP